jgi:hypothetical protein
VALALTQAKSNIADGHLTLYAAAANAHLEYLRAKAPADPFCRRPTLLAPV